MKNIFLISGTLPLLTSCLFSMQQADSSLEPISPNLCNIATSEKLKSETKARCKCNLTPLFEK